MLTFIVNTQKERSVSIVGLREERRDEDPFRRPGPSNRSDREMVRHPPSGARVPSTVSQGRGAPRSPTETLTTPRQDNLGLARIVNGAGFSISLLPNGAIFAIEHVEAGRRIMINQVLASPVAGGMGRLYLRAGGPEPQILHVSVLRRGSASAPRTIASSGRENRAACAVRSRSGCIRAQTCGYGGWSTGATASSPATSSSSRIS